MLGARNNSPSFVPLREVVYLCLFPVFLQDSTFILSGSTFEEQIGYARAVVNGEWVHVSGTTGFDYSTMTISDDVVEQAEQCLRNIEAALAEAGCTFADVVRVRYLLPDRADFEPCWPVLRRCFGEVRPAATMLVCLDFDAAYIVQGDTQPPRCPASLPFKPPRA